MKQRAELINAIQKLNDQNRTIHDNNNCSNEPTNNLNIAQSSIVTQNELKSPIHNDPGLNNISNYPKNLSSVHNDKRVSFEFIVAFQSQYVLSSH